MKRIILILLLMLPLMAGAQTYSELQTRINANVWRDGTRFQTNTYRRFYSDTLNALLQDIITWNKDGFLPLTLTGDATVTFGGGTMYFDPDFADGYFFLQTEDANDRAFIEMYPGYASLVTRDLRPGGPAEIGIYSFSFPPTVEIFGAAATYGANYTSAMTTDRHIPDIGWVKGYVDTAAVSGSSYTFENGLTESGGTVKWGGALTGETIVNLAGKSLVFDDYTGGGSFSIGEFDPPTVIALAATSTTTIAKSGSSQITVGDGDIVKITTKAQYAADYNFSNARDLPDRGYVDARAKLGKYNATAAPGTGDDSADGYSVGSIWVDVTNDDAYICLDASAGAAVWKKMTP